MTNSAVAREQSDVETGTMVTLVENREELSFHSRISSEDQRSTRGTLESTSIEGAEKIVRDEARTIRKLRAALIFIIAAAASACGFFIYKLSSKNETDSFKASFEAAASKSTQALTEILAGTLSYAYIVSVSLSSRLYMESTFVPAFPNASIDQFDTLAKGLTDGGFIRNIVWSPMIRSIEEKSSWEAYALQRLTNSSQANPPCYICGEGNDIRYPNATLKLPGVATSTCAEANEALLAGYGSQSGCIYAMQVIQPVCGCQKSLINEQNGTEASRPGANGIFRFQDNVAVVDHGPPPYIPVWQISPAGNSEKIVMFNQMSEPWRRQALLNMIETKSTVFSKTVYPEQDAIYNLDNIASYGLGTTIFLPVFESLNSGKVAGSLALYLDWSSFLTYVIPPKSDGIVIVLESTLGQMFTFRVTNGEAMLQGTGDLHDRSFDSLLIETTYQDFNELVLESNTQAQDNSTFQTACSYRIRVYPTNEFQSMYLTNKPIIYTVIVVLAFGVTTVVFLAYDYIVRRLQTKVLDSAKQSELIVSSLFPKLVRERLFLKATSQPSSPFRFGLPRLGKQGITFDNHLVSHKTRLKTYLTHPPSMDMVTGSEPIADLYPNTTVLFADIAGFTAWSSEREPSQVFRLLECLYSEFDAVARELGVFKVETIGDCYVAVTGLPEKMKYHAVIMVEFAYKCFVRMHEMLSKLESVLGPGTADLSMRIGLHSGPVTAGVLRGERARFQLFGDTVNVASRMESTGQPDKVHISQETADLLIKAGKESWVTQRGDSVLVKGKGLLQTYWANPLVTSAATNMDERTSTVSSESFGASSVRPNGTDTIDSGEWGESSLENALALKFSPSHGRDRLVEWFVELLQGLLQKIVAMRVTNGKLRSASKVPTLTTVSESAASYSESENTQFVYEITEVIEMPDFGKKNTGDSFFVDMGPVVRSQLRDYVALIASMYRDIAFHNFEHACHVAMSASKLLKRVLVPEDVNYKVESSNRLKSHKVVSKEVHDTTFGISSDPLMQFAVVFSALIHDVDHNGVTNKQLILENDPVAIKYHGKCVAEQRSIQVAWDFLMQDKYTKLRNCIYQTEAERRRFRQLLVNAVIATDIADKELSSWRKNRWDKVFHVDHPQVTYESERNRRDRKATIVFEYIIQASDVAHTMQHWHIYQKWNKRLFDERYTAYLDGREAEDPSTGWHKGEVGFFDNYVIPLARKLEECKVFGVSCDEYLSYALQNRHEWEMKGEDAVKEMVANYHHCNDDHDDTTTAPAMTV